MNHRKVTRRPSLITRLWTWWNTPPRSPADPLWLAMSIFLLGLAFHLGRLEWLTLQRFAVALATVSAFVYTIDRIRHDRFAVRMRRQREEES